MDGSNLGEEWFDGVEVPLNSGLVAVIGNQGTGKSALSDTIGLLGNSPHQESFSFLHKSHFRNPKGNKAKEFEATLVWRDGSTTSAGLNDDVAAGALETIRYIPQKHLDTVCVELEGGRAGKFDRELRQVIFSQIPKGKRLKADTLDDLIRLLTAEPEAQIRALQSELETINGGLAKTEAQLTDEHRRNLEGRIKALETQLASLSEEEPPEPVQPDQQGPEKEGQDELRGELDALGKWIENIEAEIEGVEEESASVQAKQGAAELIRGKIRAVQTAVERANTEIKPLAEQLGIEGDLLAVRVTDVALTKAEDDLAAEVRIPAHADHSFRRMLTTDSRAS